MTHVVQSCIPTVPPETESYVSPDHLPSLPLEQQSEPAVLGHGSVLLVTHWLGFLFLCVCLRRQQHTVLLHITVRRHICKKLAWFLCPHLLEFILFRHSAELRRVSIKAVLRGREKQWLLKKRKRILSSPDVEIIIKRNHYFRCKRWVRCRTFLFSSSAAAAHLCW